MRARYPALDVGRPNGVTRARDDRRPAPRRGPVRRAVRRAEISCLSARSVIDALDPATTSRCVPIGIARDGRWHVLPGPPALPAETGRMPEVHRRRRRVGRARGGDGSRELVPRTARARPIDVVFPVCTVRTARTARSRGCSSWPACPTSAPACWGPRSGWTRPCRRPCSPRPGCPVVPYVVVREPEWRDDAERRRGARARASATPCSRSRRPSARRSASRRCTTPRSCRRRSRRRSGSTRKVVRRAGDRAGPRDRVRGPRQRRPGRLGRRRDRARGPRRSTTTRRSTSTSTARGS